MFLTLGAIIAGILAVGAIVKVVRLVIATVRKFFNTHKIKDCNKVALAVKEELPNAKRILTGIFDTETSECEDGAVFEAKELDDTLSSLPAGEVIEV